MEEIKVVSEYPFNVINGIFGEQGEIKGDRATLTKMVDEAFEKLKEMPDEADMQDFEEFELVLSKSIPMAVEYYKNGKTKKEIAEQMGVSETVVHNGLAKVLRKLRHPRISKPIHQQLYYQEIIRLSKAVYDESSATQEEKELLRNYPHIFVLGCVMDRQIGYTRAWNIPLIIADKLGGKDFCKFAAKSEQWYIDVFETEKLHRFNRPMAKMFYLAVQKIKNDYYSDASRIWNDKPNSAELVSRFLDFEGVGIKIATMATNILSRDYKVKLQDYCAIDISPDIHVKRVMYKLGLLPQEKNVDFSKIEATKVVYKAKSMNPEFPGIFDLAFWKVGNEKICMNKKCNEAQCIFGRICKKQK